jgi:hypothetical protein
VQIDFHHAVTYVIARLAGFPKDEAEIIAHAAQYVDDATNEGVIRFDNQALYERLASAHKMLDYTNFNALKDHLVWVPFHFLPGNGGLPAGQDPDGEFIRKLICRPNSPVAQDMVQGCLNVRDRPNALHRLGITAHVFVDTWAHQCFAGIDHDVNRASDIHSPHGTLSDTLNAYLVKFKNAILTEVIPPIGHGEVQSFPDRPWLLWSYENGLGERIVRDNPADFTTAAAELYKVFRRFRKDVPPALPDEIDPAMLELIRTKLVTVTDEDGDVRHQKWLDAIANAEFGFGSEQPIYIPKGIGSWKYDAVGTDLDTDPPDPVFPYKSGFMTSHWKRFHDAAKAHRLHVLDDILPKYGICAA